MCSPMADLSACREDSRASRCLMFSTPTSRYFINEQKVNETLQSLYAAITADFNRRSKRGLRTKHGVPF